MVHRQAQHSLQPRVKSTCVLQEEAILDDIIDRLLDVRNGRPGKQVQLTEQEIRQLCLTAKEIFMSQPNLLELEAPIKICGKEKRFCRPMLPITSLRQLHFSCLGDIHGQYSDLLRLFEYGGFPPEANYLFLGDYVDRGKQSLETICLLLAYKVHVSTVLYWDQRSAAATWETSGCGAKSQGMLCCALYLEHADNVSLVNALLL